MEDIKGSKEALAKLLNKKIGHFAYPNGDYSRSEIEFLRKCGYKSVRTIDLGWNDINSNPFKLKAMCIEGDGSINILCGQIIGLFGYINYFYTRSFERMHPRFL